MNKCKNNYKCIQLYAQHKRSDKQILLHVKWLHDIKLNQGSKCLISNYAALTGWGIYILDSRISNNVSRILANSGPLYRISKLTYHPQRLTQADI